MALQTVTTAKPSTSNHPAGPRKASDASSINADQRAPIHPSMPHLPPA